MTGFILAAGFGTRLRPLSEHIPKALVPVCGMPLISHTCEYFKKHGISRIGANAHYLADIFEHYVADSAYQIDVFLEKNAILGTGGGIYNARDFLARQSWFCVHNVDIISTANLRHAADRLLESEDIAALIAAPPVKNGTIAYHADSGRYAGIIRENGLPSGCKAADFIGVAVYKKEFLDFITADDFSIVPVWKRVVDAGRPIGVFVEQDMYWRDIGDPQSLLSIHFDVLDGKIRLDIGEHLYVDWERKKAFPSNTPAEISSALGPYVWTNTRALPLSAQVQRALVLPDAVVGDNEVVSGAIRTKWGSIAIE